MPPKHVYGCIDHGKDRTGPCAYCDGFDAGWRAAERHYHWNVSGEYDEYDDPEAKGSTGGRAGPAPLGRPVGNVAPSEDPITTAPGSSALPPAAPPVLPSSSPRLKPLTARLVALHVNANAATQGQFRQIEDVIVSDVGSVALVYLGLNAANGSFLAAANPSVVAALTRVAVMADALLKHPQAESAAGDLTSWGMDVTALGDAVLALEQRLT